MSTITIKKSCWACQLFGKCGEVSHSKESSVYGIYCDGKKFQVKRELVDWEIVTPQRP